MLEYIITSRTKRSLLKLFLTNPDRAFYVREIAKLTDEPFNAVRRELGYLEKANLLKPHRKGNLKYYSVNKDFPFYSEMKKIIYSTVGLGDYLSGRFINNKQIKLAFVYGSVASNEETVKSDIDLFVIGIIKEDELHKIIYDAENDIGRQINYTLMTIREFNKRLKKSEPFLKRVLAGKKIVIKGKLDDYQ